MNWLLTIIFSLELLHILSIDRSGDYSKIDSTVNINLIGIKPLTNRKSDGKCCDNTEQIVCASCSFKIYIIRTDNEGMKKEFYITFFFFSNNFYKIDQVLGYAVNSNRYSKFEIKITDYYSSNVIYDMWNEFPTSTDNAYNLAGTLGIYGNDYLYAKIDVFLINRRDIRRFLIFYIEKITWITSYNNTNNFCEKLNNSSILHITPCQFKINVSIENQNIQSFNPVINYVNQDSMNLKWYGVTNNSMAFKTNPQFKFDFVDNINNQLLIDTIYVDIKEAIPSKIKMFSTITGEMNNVEISAFIRYDCNGYVGKNCQFPCLPIDDSYYCDKEKGQKHCKNGGEIADNCKKTNYPCTENPCLNGGKCNKKIDGIICKCQNGYLGQYCEKISCMELCFGGKCNRENECVCKSDFTGVMCEYSECDQSENISCFNGGKCQKLRGKNVCKCDKYLTGKSCSDPVCVPECKQGKCTLNNKNGTLFTECLKYPDKNKKRTSANTMFAGAEIYIIAISALSILFHLSLKFLLLNLSRKYLFSQVIVANGKINSDPNAYYM